MCSSDTKEAMVRNITERKFNLCRYKLFQKSSEEFHSKRPLKKKKQNYDKVMAKEVTVKLLKKTCKTGNRLEDKINSYFEILIDSKHLHQHTAGVHVHSLEFNHKEMRA